MITSTLVVVHGWATAGQRLLCSAKVVHSCVYTHVHHHVDAVLDVVHDPSDALLEVMPCCRDVLPVRDRRHLVWRGSSIHVGIGCDGERREAGSVEGFVNAMRNLGGRCVLARSKRRFWLARGRSGSCYVLGRRSTRESCLRSEGCSCRVGKQADRQSGRR
jgi:hypothetical protein